MNGTISWCRRQISHLLACCMAFSLLTPCSSAASMLPSAPQPAASASQHAGQSNTSSTTTSSADTRQYSTSTPLGTAAAPYIRPEGVPGSRPAGAAIAPGKQRRIRVIAIRLGLLLGAGIALGTVAAATLGSPRRPN